jgi:hypothetical protein
MVRLHQLRRRLWSQLSFEERLEDAISTFCRRAMTRVPSSLRLGRARSAATQEGNGGAEETMVELSVFRPASALMW